MDEELDLDWLLKSYQDLTREKGVVYPGTNPVTGRKDAWRIEYGWGSLECSNAMAASIVAALLKAVPRLIELAGTAQSLAQWQKQTEERQAEALQAGRIANYFAEDDKP